MSGALKLPPEWCEELDDALVADWAVQAMQRLQQFDAALAAVRTDPAALAELVRVLRSLSTSAASFGFHALGRKARALEDRLLRTPGLPRPLLLEASLFRGEVAEAFAEARNLGDAAPGHGQPGFTEWFLPPSHASRGRQRRLVIGVLEEGFSLEGATAGVTLARAATHLVCTSGAAAQAYREAGGDGVVLGLGLTGTRADAFSDLSLPASGPRQSLLAAACDGAVLTSAAEQPLADARALLLAGKPVVHISTLSVHVSLRDCGPGRLVMATGAARAVLALLIELSRD
jgi:HPt (histidine-containing phosphotransfer) domain-containing protein